MKNESLVRFRLVYNPIFQGKSLFDKIGVVKNCNFSEDCVVVSFKGIQDIIIEKECLVEVN